VEGCWRARTERRGEVAPILGMLDLIHMIFHSLRREWGEIGGVVQVWSSSEQFSDDAMSRVGLSTGNAVEVRCEVESLRI